MSAISYDKHDSKRLGLSGFLSRAIMRGELFAGLFIIGCANGICSVVIVALDNNDDWLSVVLSISAIVVFACLAGIWLVQTDKTEQIRTADIVLGVAFLIFIAVSVGSMNWVALTGLSLYVLLFTGSPVARRGATVLLAATVPMLWSKLLFAFFAKFFLDFDSALVALLLGTQRDGNTVRFADHSGNLVIFPGCSSVANVSLAFLFWVTVAQATNHRRSAADVFWCLLACASVIVVNVTRMAIEGKSHANYAAFHNSWGDMIFNSATLVLMGACVVMGTRRELFPRP